MKLCIGSHDDPPDRVSSIEPAATTLDVESESDASASESEAIDSVSHGDSCSSPGTSSISIECDIGKLQDSGVDIKGLSRDDKYRLITTEPNPDPLSYPRKRPCPSSNLRRFKPKWLKHHPWMHYSQFSDGVYCRACVVFSPYQVRGHNLGKFVLEPFRYWTKTANRATEHAKNQYHRSAISMMTEFLTRYESPSQAVDVILSSQVKQTMETNQKVIESLLRIVILCGKQGLALRGHRDDKIDWQSDERSNEGNFVQLVRFRADTDTVLSTYLSKAPKNAHYTSKTIQNELLSVFGDSIRNGIISEVKSAKYYSIIADEVTDAANHEELSLVFRYVYKEQVREVFVDFLEVERITGRVLGEAILNWLKSHNIPSADMRGQCYDGASNMRGARSGVKAVVQEAAPKAMYYHCAAHCLNLAVVSACRIQAFKNAESYIGEIARFFKYSAKRQQLLDRCIEACDSTPNAKKLKDACRTRWIERIDSYAVFLDLLPALHICLEAMAHPELHEELGTDWSWDGETITV